MEKANFDYLIESIPSSSEKCYILQMMQNGSQDAYVNQQNEIESYLLQGNRK